MQERVSRGGVFARVRVHPLACLLALATLAVGLLAGCGGGSSSTSSASGASAAASSASTKVPSYLGAAAHGHTASVVAVARVSDMEIAKSSYDHWLSVERALGVTDNPSHQALGFLITSDWVLGEATARHLAVSEAEVKQRFAQVMPPALSEGRAHLQQFLPSRARPKPTCSRASRWNCSSQRIAAQLDRRQGRCAAQGPSLTSIPAGFPPVTGRAYTTCEAGYVMDDCSEYSGGPEDLTAPNSSSSSSSGGPASGSSSSSSSSSGRSSTGHSASGSAGSSAGSASGANSSRRG